MGSDLRTLDLRRFFDVLAEGTRLRVVGLLALEPRTVADLARTLEIRPAAISRHLGRLRQLGLVKPERDGRRLRYRLDTGVLLEWSRQLAADEAGAHTPETGVDDEDERRVLAIFLADGRLAQVPARRKKRMVVLRWLAEHFRPGERYSEAQVNEILGRYHDDFATLRRLLVDEELMQRGAGLYWRAGTLPPPTTPRPGDGSQPRA